MKHAKSDRRTEYSHQKEGERHTDVNYSTDGDKKEFNEVRKNQSRS